MLHGGPGSRFPQLGMIARDQKVAVGICSKSGRWCEVEYNGKDGWVRASHLAIVNSAPADKPRSVPTVDVNTPAGPVTVTTEKAGKGDKDVVAGKTVIITFKSADGKVSSTMTVAAGSNVVVTASGRSRCELRAAVNP